MIGCALILKVSIFLKNIFADIASAFKKFVVKYVRSKKVRGSAVVVRCEFKFSAWRDVAQPCDDRMAHLDRTAGCAAHSCMLYS